MCVVYVYMNVYLEMLLRVKIVQANDLYALWEHVNIEKYCDCNLRNRREFAYLLEALLFTTLTMCRIHKTIPFTIPRFMGMNR